MNLGLKFQLLKQNSSIIFKISKIKKLLDNVTLQEVDLYYNDHNF